MGSRAAVADAWAVIALVQREGQAYLQMRRFLHQASTGSLRLLINVVNLGEVYYRIWQSHGPERADAGLQRVRAMPLERVGVREGLALEAARLKALHHVDYADAFAVATARLEGAPLLTGDARLLALPREVVRVIRLER